MAEFENRTPVIPQLNFKNISSKRCHGFSDDLTVSILGMADIYLAYPGLFPDGHGVHKGLAAIEAGSKVILEEQKGRVYILDETGQSIASLSKKGSAQWRDHLQNILNARVLGVIKRRRQDNEENGYKEVKMESWELPLVEILHRI